LNKINKHFESCKDIDNLQKDITDPIKKFLSITNLSNYGINRLLNNVKNSKYDGPILIHAVQKKAKDINQQKILEINTMV
jgi:hypothetical protein